jgi:hypothetical protein
MFDVLSECILAAWKWARTNDLPNWFAFAFTVILWPLALILWQRRKVNGVQGLEVHFAEGQISIGDKPFPAIDIQFTNHTGSVAYISGVRIRGCTESFPVPIEASRDRAANSYHLKFMKVTTDSKLLFVLREVTLQTSETAKTCMPVASAMFSDFFKYTPSWVARRLRKRQYFLLEYTAMVGTVRHSVSTLY